MQAKTAFAGKEKGHKQEGLDCIKEEYGFVNEE
ncbi:hypothetical protein Barb7_01698 [Bacteroidales bacterium Barb7]|nr:hypothetical protein Barb7_01698 [Bacteroidales bacterium Barb7]